MRHTGYKTHKAGVYANLRCCAASSYGGCGAKLVGPIRKSSERPTNVDCFRELGRVIQRDHDPTCIAAAQELQAAEKDAADASTKRAADADEGAVSLNATEVLMLHRRLKMIQQRAAEANKATLETEKERDELHNQIEQIEEQLHPKRARTHDTACDAHEIYVSWCTETLCEEVVQLLVHGMLACARERTWIPVEWPRSLGGRLYAC